MANDYDPKSPVTHEELEAVLTQVRKQLQFRLAAILLAGLLLITGISIYAASQRSKVKQEAIDIAVARAVPKAVDKATSASFALGIHQERLGCRRLDVTRGALYRLIYRSLVGPVLLPADLPPRVEKAYASQRLAAVNELRRLIRSVRKFAIGLPLDAASKPLRQLPHTIAVNCKEAYPSGPPIDKQVQQQTNKEAKK